MRLRPKSARLLVLAFTRPGAYALGIIDPSTGASQFVIVEVAEGGPQERSMDLVARRDEVLADRAR